MMTLRLTILWLIALSLAANGLYMLVAPESWYHAMPTVSHTGPFNPHFVRDIGAAYLACSGALVWLALGREGGSAAALTGGTFLLFHGLIHLWDTIAGRATFAHLTQDFVTVLLVPVLVLWLAWPRRIPAAH